MITDFSSDTMEVKRKWHNNFSVPGAGGQKKKTVNLYMQHKHTSVMDRNKFSNEGKLK